MTKQELMQRLKTEFQSLITQYHLSTKEINITAKSLSPEEAIGNTTRKDFPILTGQEVMLQAEYQGSFGQAFTDAPSEFKGTLTDILNLDLMENPYDSGLFIASLNAVMAKLGLIEHTVHCRCDEPELCSLDFVHYVDENYKGKKIALVGYQPSILDALSKICELRVLDLSPNNVNQIRYGIKIENGITDYNEVVLEWADVILCTGSTLCNGTIVNFIDIDKEVLFFGITVAGAAKILGLNRLCPKSI